VEEENQKGEGSKLTQVHPEIGH